MSESFDHIAYKKSVRDEWQRTAQAWHEWIPVIDEWLREPTRLMLDLAGVADGKRILDIAAGDGSQSIAAAHRVGPNGSVLATDIAGNFVDHAKATARHMGLANLEARVMDAENLDLPDMSFDAVISRLGVMYLPDRQKGFAEMWRVLDRAGRAAVVVFGAADKSPFFSLPVSVIRRRAKLPPPTPGQAGPFSLGDPATLEACFRRAGFGTVDIRTLEAPLRLPSAEACLEFRRDASGTLQQMIRSVDPSERDDTWREIEDRLRDYETPRGFISPCELLVGAGAK